MRITSIILLSLVMGVFVPAVGWGSDDGAEGVVTLGVQGLSEDGNRDKFREDSFGEQSGLFLDRFELFNSGETFNLDIDARFTTGRNGWFDLEATGDRWRGGVKATFISSWSNTSFASDFLPSGTPVASLYPGTTALDPIFGISEPRSKTVTGEAWVTYRLSSFSRLTLRAGARSRDGERIPNIGGFSFSDVGTASFYTAGLETFDSSSSWIELEGVFEAGPVGLKIQGGILSVDTDRTFNLPAYGQTQLLDINQWRDGLDSDTSWFRADARWSGDVFAVYGGVSYADTSTDPSGGDRRVDSSGAVVADGLSIRGGSLDAQSFAAALGGKWRICEALTLTAAMDTRTYEASGSIDLFNRETPLVPTASNADENRLGGTVQVKFNAGPFRARLRTRATSTDLDRSEERDIYSQDIRRRTDRLDARLDAAVQLADGWDLSGWLRYDDADVNVDLGDLWNGYTAGDWSRETTSGAIALRYKGGGVHAALSATSASTDLTTDAPWYDPIFDPSVDLIPVFSDQKSTRFAGSLLWPFDRGSLWVEAGLLNVEYDILSTAPPAGFAPVSEKISGTVAALGADLGVWNGGTLTAHLEWIDDSDLLDNTIIRGHLQVDHELNARLALFGRWAYWDFSNSFAPSDDYQISVFAAGAQIRF